MSRHEPVLKAQEDAEKLRSVVMPLEKEIAGLKAKLTTAEDRVKELEASKVSRCRVSEFQVVEFKKILIRYGYFLF